MGGGKITAFRQRENWKRKKNQKKKQRGGDGTNNRSPMFHRHSSVEKFQMKKLSINGLVLTANKNTCQKLCGGLCRNKDPVYDQDYQTLLKEKAYFEINCNSPDK